MSENLTPLVQAQAEVDLANRQANVVNTCARLDYEKAWVLHRALTLNVAPQDASEAWKGSAENTPKFNEDQQKELLKKYYDHLMTL